MFRKLIQIITIIANIAFSQQFRPLNISYESTGNFSNNDKAKENSQIFTLNTKIGTANFSTKLPLILDTNSLIVISQFDYSNTTIEKYKFNSLSNSLILYKILNNHYDCFVFFQPKFSSNQQLDLLSGSAYTYNFGFALGKEYSKNLYTALGVYYIHSFGQELYFPIITFKWKANPKFQIDIEFPDQISANYLSSDKLRLSIINRYLSNQFRLQNKSEFPAYFRYISNSVGIACNYNLYGAFWVDTSLWYYINNKMTTFDNQKLLTSTVYSNALSLRIGLSYEIKR